METTTYDVCVNGEKRGVAYDSLPVTYETDEECLHALHKILAAVKPEHKKLVGRATKALNAADDADVDFSLTECLELGSLSMLYPELGYSICGVVDYLTSILDFDGDFSPEILLTAASLTCKLQDVYKEGEKLVGQTEFSDSEDEEVESEEEIESDEEAVEEKFSGGVVGEPIDGSATVTDGAIASYPRLVELESLDPVQTRETMSMAEVDAALTELAETQE